MPPGREKKLILAKTLPAVLSTSCQKTSVDAVNWIQVLWMLYMPLYDKHWNIYGNMGICMESVPSKHFGQGKSC